MVSPQKVFYTVIAMSVNIHWNDDFVCSCVAPYEICPEDYAVSMLWRRTPSGELAFNRCPPNATGMRKFCIWHKGKFKPKVFTIYDQGFNSHKRTEISAITIEFLKTKASPLFLSSCKWHFDKKKHWGESDVKHRFRWSPSSFMDPNNELCCLIYVLN